MGFEWGGDGPTGPGCSCMVIVAIAGGVVVSASAYVPHLLGWY